MTSTAAVEPRERAEALDRADRCARFRRRFVIADPELIYFDGNSLGRLPVATRDRLRKVIDEEWGGELIRGWDTWIELARVAGDVLATGVLEARPGEVVLSDSTSVNLYKLAAAALDARPGRSVIVTDDDNFPTDLYVLAGLAQARGLELRIVHTDLDQGVSAEAVAAALDSDTALVSLSHVAYRSGAIADMPASPRPRTRPARSRCGTCPTRPARCRAASVRGCRPGGRLHVQASQRRAGRAGVPLCTVGPAQPLRQPIWGWFGQRDQFAMAPPTTRSTGSSGSWSARRPCSA